MSTVPARRKSSPREPAYVKIERYLEKLLADGGGVDESLPTENALAQRFGVSVMTVRHAYSNLVNAGRVARVRFKGTFAAAHLVDDLAENDRLTSESFLKRWRSQSTAVRMEVLTLELRPAPPEVAAQFGVPVETELTFLARRRRVNSQPVAWDLRWLAAETFHRLSADLIENNALYEALAAVGVESTTAKADIGARPATKRDSEVLECGANEVVLERNVVVHGPDDEVVLVGLSIYPASRFQFRIKESLVGREPMPDSPHAGALPG